jgi:hypothetical protein
MIALRSLRISRVPSHGRQSWGRRRSVATLVGGGCRLGSFGCPDILKCRDCAAHAVTDRGAGAGFFATSVCGPSANLCDGFCRQVRARDRSVASSVCVAEPLLVQFKVFGLIISRRQRGRGEGTGDGLIPDRAPKDWRQPPDMLRRIAGTAVICGRKKHARRSRVKTQSDH